MTMAYILAVNPGILSAAGMGGTAVLIAACIASFIGTMLMGLLANLPFALSAGMAKKIPPLILRIDGAVYSEYIFLQIFSRSGSAQGGCIY